MDPTMLVRIPTSPHAALCHSFYQRLESFYMLCVYSCQHSSHSVAPELELCPRGERAKSTLPGVFNSLIPTLEGKDCLKYPPGLMLI